MKIIKRSVSLFLAAAMFISFAAAKNSIYANAISDEDEKYFTELFSTANQNSKSTIFYTDKNTGEFYIQSGSIILSGTGIRRITYLSSLRENGRSEVRNTYKWISSEFDENRGTFYVDEIEKDSDQDMADSFKEWLDNKAEIIVDDEYSLKSGTSDTEFYSTDDFIREYNSSGSQTRTIYVLADDSDIRLHSGLELSEEDEKLIGITWESDDDSVAKADNYGYLQPQTEGTCRVKASLADSGVSLTEIEVNVCRDQQEIDDKKNTEVSSQEDESSCEESSYEESSNTESDNKYRFDGDPKKSEYDFEKMIPARKYDSLDDLFKDKEFVDNVLEYERKAAEMDPMETLHRYDSETSVISYTLRALYDTTAKRDPDDPNAISMAEDIAKDIAYSVKRHLVYDQTIKVRVIVCNYDNTRWFDKTFSIS